MTSFVNRDAERAMLERDYARSGASLFVLYGRRRLGKTSLLRRFADDKPAVYHMADRSTETDARRLLSGSMAAALREPTLMSSDFPDWYALFAAYDRLRAGAPKPILILDEFQYLCEQQPAFSSIIQRWWDQHWSGSSIMIVLCGSILSMMKRETLAQSSPLYGRRTGQCLLTPLRFAHAQSFWPLHSPVDRLSMWALTGGVPRYVELAAPYPDFAQALRGLALDRAGALYAEALFLLQDEVSTPNVYWSLLHTIAGGVHRISEIAARMALPANQLTRYLAVLQDMGLVRRIVPVTEPNPSRSKRGIYQVADPFLRLWYGAIAPCESLLEFDRLEEAERLLQPRLTRHLAWAFEEICREYAEDRAGATGAVRVGRHWDRTQEFDLVGVNEQNDVVFAGECKWSRNPMELDVARSLARKVETAWPHRAAAIRLSSRW